MWVKNFSAVAGPQVECKNNNFIELWWAGGVKYALHLQSTSKKRTVVGFRIESYAGPGHLKTGPFENRTYLSGFRMASLDRFINKSHKKYFIHAKTV
jgi:predicted SPOUT superfamily RNA methylase MTH1